MNDMPSESYQRSLVLEDWTTSVGTVFPSTETPSYRSDGTCSESSVHNFLHLSDTEDSIANSNLCALFGSECSRDTAMCIDIPYTDKSFNTSDCQIPTTKSKEDLLDGGFSSLISSENVQNWKNLLLQVNNSEQHLKFSNSMVQRRECVNRATVVKLTPLKDEPLQNNKINNEKHTLIGGQHEESHENKIIGKELSLLNNGCLKDDNLQKNKQIPITDGLSSTKCNISALLKRRKSTNIKSKHPFAKSFLSPLSYYRKHAKRIYDKYFKMNCVHKYKFQKPSKTAFPNDHAYSISKLPVSKWQNCLRIDKVWQRQKQKRTYNKHATLTDTQEDSKVCMKSVIDKDQLLNNSLKAEPVHNNINVFEINNHNEETSLLSKSSTEMDMPILTPLVITEGIVGASSPNSPPMPTLIPFTSENEHPPNPLVDCIPLLSSTSSDLINIGKHKNCESITSCENRLGSFGHECNITDVEDWPEHTSSNENVQIKSPSDSNREVNGSCSYQVRETCVLDQYRALGKSCRKARKSFPRPKLSGESSSLKSITTESFSANCSMSIVDNLKLQNTSNYQPVVLLERIPSVSSSNTIEMEDMLHDNEKTSVQFPPEKTYGKDCVEPEMDIIDGVKFFSFISECQLKKFIKNSKNSLSSNGYDESEDENHKKMGVIIPTKTNDITRIKGWRNKLFIQEPCPSPVSYSSWEHLVTKDLDSTMDFNELQNTVSKSKYEYEKSKHNPLKESNLEITFVTESCLLEPKPVEENKQQFYLTEIEKDKSNAFVKRIEESKINNGLKKLQRNSADNDDRLTESKAVVSTKKFEECYTTSLNTAHATSNNYIKRMEGSDSSICLLNKINTVQKMCSEKKDTLPTENKECDSELMKLLKDKTIGHTSRPTSVNDILKTLPKFTKQVQKITDDDKTNNSALLKRLEEKHVGKSTRSAFVSDILDDFLKTRSNLGINLLAQCNPNVLPIPADSTIFSVGLLRKQEIPVPKMQNSLRETANSHNNKKYMLNVGKESANNNGYTYKTKHSSLTTDISSDLQESKQTMIKVENLNDEKIIEAHVKKENNIESDTDVNANTCAKQKPVTTKMYENAVEHCALSSESSSESEDEQIRGLDVVNVNNFEGSSYTSRASANVKQTLPLIRNLYWSRKAHADKRLAELFEELNSRHSIESHSNLFCPIIDKSLAVKAVSALTNANKVSNSKACNLDDYNTFGKIAATKSFSQNIIQKPISDPLKDSNHRHRQCSDKTKSPPYSNINQATRSKRLIRLPARYMDSVEVAAGTEGRNLPISLCNEFKQRMYKRKLEGEFNQHLTSQKCIDSHSSMLDELPDVNYISAKGKEYGQSSNSSFSDTSESCSRTSCVSIIQEQNSSSENESTKCNVYDKTISWINSNEGQNTCFTKSHVYNKSEVGNKDKLETLSPRGRELLNCMDKVIRVSLPRLSVDPEMVVKCQNNGAAERTINLDNSVSFDSQIFTLMKDNCGFSIKNQTEINTSSASLYQKHVAHSENAMQSSASASLHQCSSNGKNSQQYSRLKLSSLQSLSVPEVIPISVDNTKTHGTNHFANKKPTLLRVQFSQTEGGLFVRKLKNDEMKKVLLRNLPSKCVRRFSCNNDRLERRKSDGQVIEMHTVTSPSSINTFMRSHRKRKQNKCKLSCCNSDGNIMEQKRSCTSSVQQCSTQPHKKSRSVSLDNFGQSLSSCEKRDESTSSSDHSDNCSREKMISEMKDHTEHFNICDSRYDGNMLQGKPVVQLTPERERPINELKQTSELFDKEKKTHIDRNRFSQKRFNITEAQHRYPSSKKVSMKFTDKHLASLQSSTTGRQIISSTTPEEMTNINLNELLDTAQKLCGGPCVIKRVRLKNGKTVYVYETLKADTCNGSDDAAVDNAQHQLNVTEKCLLKDNTLKRASSSKSLNIVYSDDVKDTCKSSDDITIDFAQNPIDDNAVTGKHLLTNDIVQEASSLESLNIVYSDDETISLEDDHSSTSIWMSGSGEPCFVTKFSAKRNVDSQDENANSEKPTIPTIISCASISEEEFAKSLNSSESAMEIDLVSDISQ